MVLIFTRDVKCQNISAIFVIAVIFFFFKNRWELKKLISSHCSTRLTWHIMTSMATFYNIIGETLIKCSKIFQLCKNSKFDSIVFILDTTSFIDELILLEVDSQISISRIPSDFGLVPGLALKNSSGCEGGWRILDLPIK